ncbi:MAG: class I SAM-dependent methyltransferase [Patescibacteria group bacterium]
MKNKRHYYDGWLYEMLIDPAFSEIREIIIEQIEDNTKVLDIGCGTGALVLALAFKCSQVTGVELSEKMITLAQKRQKEKEITNVDFIHTDATKLPQFTDKYFDYAIISMVIHEMPPVLRVPVLTEAKRLAKKVILADYSIPQPFSLYGLRNRSAEFLAGREHFRGFLDYNKNKGLQPLLDQSGLSILKSIDSRTKTIKIVIAD